mmetsp:Transcript_31336/g.78523  ORF Transcript_31336/g.78523 Transcript_31336/m.78523 type:complete len:608 (+) Transcript_31336:97-1920(+)
MRPSVDDHPARSSLSLSRRQSLAFADGGLPMLSGCSSRSSGMEPPGAGPPGLDPSLASDAAKLCACDGDLFATAAPVLGARRTLSRRLSLSLSEALPEQDVEPQAGRMGVYWPAIKAEFQRMCRMAIPLLINNVANFGVTIIVLAYIGHLGKHALACATLGGSLFNVLGQSLFIGCASTLETLCGQAVGAGNYRLLGLEMVRCMILMTATMPAFAVLYFFTGPILVGIGQNPDVAAGAAAYLIRLLPALWLMGMTECFKRALTSQGIVIPNMAIAILTTSLTPLFAWFYISHLDLGYLGAAHAVTSGYTLNLLCFAATFAAVNWRAQGTTEYMWPGWRWEMLKGFGVILKIAFPTTMMICLDWWTWESLILLSGLLPDPDVSVAVMGLGFNVVALCFMVPLAIVSATAIGIANFLGANQPKRARISYYMGLAFTTCMMAVVCSVIFAFRRRIGGVYTDEPEVLEALDRVMPLICIILWCDGFQMINTGPLRGSGRQAVGATINLVALWGFGVPLAATLGFHYELGVQGFWYALLAAFVLQAVIMFVTVNCVINMDTEAHKAQVRMQERAAVGDSAPPTRARPGSATAGMVDVEEPLLGGDGGGTERD